MARQYVGLARRAALRRISVAGRIIFVGAFVFVASAFVAMVYGWNYHPHA